MHSHLKMLNGGLSCLFGEIVSWFSCTHHILRWDLVGMTKFDFGLKLIKQISFGEYSSRPLGGYSYGILLNH